MALNQDGKNILLNEASISLNKQSDMIEAFEMLLCYWAWLKKDEYWAGNDMEALHVAKTAICKSVSQLFRLFPWTSGCQWKVPKMQEQLQIAHNIHLFGAHHNVHAGPQEHNHIENAKNLSKRTQKCKELFDVQIENRLVE